MRSKEKRLVVEMLTFVAIALKDLRTVLMMINMQIKSVLTDLGAVLLLYTQHGSEMRSTHILPAAVAFLQAAAGLAGLFGLGDECFELLDSVE